MVDGDNYEEGGIINSEEQRTEEIDRKVIFEQLDNYSGDEFYIRFVSRGIDYPDNN